MSGIRCFNHSDADGDVPQLIQQVKTQLVVNIRHPIVTKACMISQNVIAQKEEWLVTIYYK